MSNTNTSITNVLLQGAMAYAQTGIHVFPAGKDKRPLTPNGFKNATTDESVIREWWNRYPNANVAIATGKVSGIIVLDIDPRNGGDENISDYIDFIPDTLKCSTPRGTHIYFKYPSSGEVRTCKLDGNPGLDVRSDGAYVLAPPSVVGNGEYTFLDFDGLVFDEWPFGTDKPKPEVSRENNPSIASNSVINIQEVRSALNAIDPDVDYEQWVNILMAVHSELPGHIGFDLCDEWSRKGSKYKEGEVFSKWRGFSHDSGITISTLFRAAMDNGWRWEGGAEVVDLSKIVDEIRKERKPEGDEGESEDDKKTKNKFPFKTVFEVCSHSPKHNWLIDGFVERNTMMQIFGDPESGKSLIAIDMGLCIATGNPWMSRPSAQGSVFYICGEGFGGLTRRFKAWEYANQFEYREDTPFYVSEMAADLTSPHSTKDVIDSIRGLCEASGDYPKLIIVDTLARNFGGGDENNTQMMNQFVRHVDVLRTGFEATMMIVHHTGHMVKNRARGAMPLIGALDVDFIAKKDDEGIIKFESTKVKDFEKPRELFFSIESMRLTNEPGQDTTGPFIKRVEPEGPQSSSVVSIASAKGKGAGRPGVATERAMEALELMQRRLVERGEPGWVYVDQWKFKCMKDHDISDGVFRKIKQRQLESGIIEKRESDNKTIRISGFKI